MRGGVISAAAGERRRAAARSPAGDGWGVIVCPDDNGGGGDRTAARIVAAVVFLINVHRSSDDMIDRSANQPGIDEIAEPIVRSSGERDQEMAATRQTTGMRDAIRLGSG
jgi:hypothetical protein